MLLDDDSFDYRQRLAPLDIQELRSMVFNVVKVTHDVSHFAIEPLRSLHVKDHPSDSWTTKKLMTAITGLDKIRYNSCIEGCISYALPNYASLKECPIRGCGRSRFKVNGVPYAQHSSIPIIHRLRLMYSDKEQAIEMMGYRKWMEGETETEYAIYGLHYTEGFY